MKGDIVQTKVLRKKRFQQFPPGTAGIVDFDGKTSMAERAVKVIIVYNDGRMGPELWFDPAELRNADEDVAEFVSYIVKAPEQRPTQAPPRPAQAELMGVRFQVGAPQVIPTMAAPQPPTEPLRTKAVAVTERPAPVPQKPKDRDDAIMGMFEKWGGR